jgi:hypothetical protein
LDTNIAYGFAGGVGIELIERFTQKAEAKKRK